MIVNLLTLLLAISVPAPQSLPIVTLHAPNAVLRVQVAKTQAQRERGLMGVTRLRAHTGMLFIFRSDDPIAFWMKDTLIPLDMVFIGSGGAVRKVFANVPIAPLQMADAQIPREQARAKYVIELPAGEALRDGLLPGARVGDLPYARTP